MVEDEEEGGVRQTTVTVPLLGPKIRPNPKTRVQPQQRVTRDPDILQLEVKIFAKSIINGESTEIFVLPHGNAQ